MPPRFGVRDRRKSTFTGPAASRAARGAAAAKAPVRSFKPTRATRGSTPKTCDRIAILRERLTTQTACDRIEVCAPDAIHAASVSLLRWFDTGRGEDTASPWLKLQHVQSTRSVEPPCQRFNLAECRYAPYSFRRAAPRASTRYSLPASGKTEKLKPEKLKFSGIRTVAISAPAGQSETKWATCRQRCGGNPAGAPAQFQHLRSAECRDALGTAFDAKRLAPLPATRYSLLPTPMKATGAWRTITVAAAAFMSGRGAIDRDRHEPAVVARQRQQRMAVRATHSSANVFAQEKHEKCEDQAKADRERNGKDGHGEKRLVVNGAADGRRRTPRFHDAASLVDEPFLRGEPVFLIAPVRTARLEPQEVSGVSDLRVAGLADRERESIFHGRNRASWSLRECG